MTLSSRSPGTECASSVLPFAHTVLGGAQTYTWWCWAHSPLLVLMWYLGVILLWSRFPLLCRKRRLPSPFPAQKCLVLGRNCQQEGLLLDELSLIFTVSSFWNENSIHQSLLLLLARRYHLGRTRMLHFEEEISVKSPGRVSLPCSCVGLWKACLMAVLCAPQAPESCISCTR